MSAIQAPVAQAVTVSLNDLVNGNVSWGTPASDSCIPGQAANTIAGTVSFDTLTEAFGPSSLGIIVVKDLPEKFVQLRKQVLSNASYLAALSQSELGKLLTISSAG